MKLYRKIPASYRMFVFPVIGALVSFIMLMLSSSLVSCLVWLSFLLWDVNYLTRTLPKKLISIEGLYLTKHLHLSTDQLYSLSGYDFEDIQRAFSIYYIKHQPIPSTKEEEANAVYNFSIGYMEETGDISS